MYGVTVARMETKKKKKKTENKTDKTQCIHHAPRAIACPT